MAVFFAEVLDVATGCFKNAQAQEPEHCDKCEVVVVARLSRLAEKCFKLQVRQAEGG